MARDALDGRRLDSILTIRFSDVAKGGRIDLVHVNVPQHDHGGVTKGWPKYYWAPLKAIPEEANESEIEVR